MKKVKVLASASAIALALGAAAVIPAGAAQLGTGGLTLTVHPDLTQIRIMSHNSAGKPELVIPESAQVGDTVSVQLPKGPDGKTYVFKDLVPLTGSIDVTSADGELLGTLTLDDADASGTVSADDLVVYTLAEGQINDPEAVFDLGLDAVSVDEAQVSDPISSSEVDGSGVIGDDAIASDSAEITVGDSEKAGKDGQEQSSSTTVNVSTPDKVTAAVNGKPIDMAQFLSQLKLPEGFDVDSLGNVKLNVITVEGNKVSVPIKVSQTQTQSQQTGDVNVSNSNKNGSNKSTNTIGGDTNTVNGTVTNGSGKNANALNSDATEEPVDPGFSRVTRDPEAPASDEAVDPGFSRVTRDPEAPAADEAVDPGFSRVTRDPEAPAADEAVDPGFSRVTRDPEAPADESTEKKAIKNVILPALKNSTMTTQTSRVPRNSILDLLGINLDQDFSNVKIWLGDPENVVGENGEASLSVPEGDFSVANGNLTFVPQQDFTGDVTDVRFGIIDSAGEVHALLAKIHVYGDQNSLINDTIAGTRPMVDGESVPVDGPGTRPMVDGESVPDKESDSTVTES